MVKNKKYLQYLKEDPDILYNAYDYVTFIVFVKNNEIALEFMDDRETHITILKNIDNIKYKDKIEDSAIIFGRYRQIDNKLGFQYRNEYPVSGDAYEFMEFYKTTDGYVFSMWNAENERYTDDWGVGEYVIEMMDEFNIKAPSTNDFKTVYNFYRNEGFDINIIDTTSDIYYCKDVKILDKFVNEDHKYLNNDNWNIKNVLDIPKYSVYKKGDIQKEYDDDFYITYLNKIKQLPQVYSIYKQLYNIKKEMHMSTDKSKLLRKANELITTIKNAGLDNNFIKFFEDIFKDLFDYSTKYNKKQKYNLSTPEGQLKHKYTLGDSVDKKYLNYLKEDPDILYGAYNYVTFIMFINRNNEVVINIERENTEHYNLIYDVKKVDNIDKIKDCIVVFGRYRHIDNKLGFKYLEGMGLKSGNYENFLQFCEENDGYALSMWNEDDERYEAYTINKYFEQLRETYNLLPPDSIDFKSVYNYYKDKIKIKIIDSTTDVYYCEDENILDKFVNTDGSHLEDGEYDILNVFDIPSYATLKKEEPKDEYKGNFYINTMNKIKKDSDILFLYKQLANIKRKLHMSTDKSKLLGKAKYFMQILRNTTNDKDIITLFNNNFSDIDGEQKKFIPKQQYNLSTQQGQLKHKYTLGDSVNKKYKSYIKEDPDQLWHKGKHDDVAFFYIKNLGIYTRFDCMKTPSWTYLKDKWTDTHRNLYNTLNNVSTSDYLIAGRYWNGIVSFWETAINTQKAHIINLLDIKKFLKDWKETYNSYKIEKMQLVDTDFYPIEIFEALFDVEDDNILLNLDLAHYVFYKNIEKLYDRWNEHHKEQYPNFANYILAVIHNEFNDNDEEIRDTISKLNRAKQALHMLSPNSIQAKYKKEYIEMLQQQLNELKGIDTSEQKSFIPKGSTTNLADPNDSKRIKYKYYMEKIIRNK